jgi:WD40 repeat protein
MPSSIFADAGGQARAADVVRRLTDARLLVKGKEPDGEAFVEPAHDALVRGWGRLLQWVREENESKFPLSQQQRLARAAEDWHRADKGASSGLLWSDGSRSAQLSPLVRKKVPWLNRRELAFAQRSVRGRWIAMGTAAAAVLTIAVAGVVAVIGGRRASARAEQVRIGAVVRTASAMVTEDPLLARLLLGSLDSATVHNADDATRLNILGVALSLRSQPQVLATFGNAGTELTAAALSPDGSRVVTATSIERRVRVWNSDGTGTPTELPDVPGVPSVVAFSANSRFVVAGGREGWIRIWALGDSARPPRVVRRVEPKPLEEQETRYVDRLEFSPDGSRVLIVYQGQLPEILDLAGDAPPRNTAGEYGTTATFGTDASQVILNTYDNGVYSVALTADTSAPLDPVRKFPMREVTTQMAVSPDRTRLALGSVDGLVRIYSLVKSTRPLTVASDSGRPILALAWSEDGSQLVSTTSASTATVSDARTGRRLEQMRRTEEPMQTATVGPEATRLVTTSTSNFQALVWTSGDPTPIALAGQTQQLVHATFAGDSRRLFTASMDGSARLWDLGEEPFYSRRAQLPPFGSPADDRSLEEELSVMSTAFSADSRQLALGFRNGEVFVLQVDSLGADPTSARQLSHEPWSVEHLEFSADGSRLFGIGRFGVRTTWRLNPADSGTRIRAQNPLPSTVLVLRTIGGNRRVAASLTNTLNGAVLFELTGDAPRRSLKRHGSEQGCIAFTDTGSHIADCEIDSTVVVRRLDDTGSSRVIRRPRTVPSGVTFSHDGTQLAVGFGDGSVRVYGPSAADTGRLLSGHLTRVRELSFSPGDGMLLTNSDDGTVRLWDLRGARPTVTLRPRGALVADAQFLPDGRRVLTRGLQEADVRIWNADATGGFVSTPTGGVELKITDVSPDGRWLLTGTDRATAALFPLDPEAAVRPLRRITAACLTVDERIRYLLEPAADAAKRREACERTRAARATR